MAGAVGKFPAIAVKLKGVKAKIPNAFGVRRWLLIVDFCHVLHVEAQEIDHFANRIDLRLECILALGQHG
jgi:hypothetical protein